MKTGRSINELAAELTRQASAKRDYLADTKAIRVVPELEVTSGIGLDLGGDRGVIGIKQLAHEQIAEHVKIPKAYYDRMLQEEPELLCTNVQKWFEKYPATRLVRTLDGASRAFLSNSHRTLDNYDFANAVLPVIGDRGLEILSCEVTEHRLYIKAVDTKLFRDVPAGHRWGDGTHTIFDTCAPAIILANSEVGCGRLVVETGVYTRACTNLALWSNGGMKKTHVGVRNKVLNEVTDIDHLLSDETKRKTDDAIWAQVRDVIASAFRPDLLDQRIEKLVATTKNTVEGSKVVTLVDNTAKAFGLNTEEKGSVLDHLMKGGNLSQYGLHSAITRAAQDQESYDRATDLEYLGGRVVELSRSEWNDLAAAA